MSLTTLFQEGFEEYTTASTTVILAAHRWDGLQSAGIGTNYGRFGSVGLSCINATTSGTKTLPTATSVVGLAMAVNPIAMLNGAALFVIYDSAGTVQGTVTRAADGSVSVWRGNSVTLLKTSAAGVLPSGQYLNIEAQCKVDPAAGTWDVWVGSNCIISETGLNTRGSAVVGSNAARCAFGSGSGNGTVYVDDIHFYDASARTGASGAGTPASSTFEHYGDKRVQTLFPNGAGTGDVNPGNWTQVGGTGGSPWTAVNERPQNGDTSYLADPTVGDIKSFALDDLAAGTTGVSAITMTGCFEKDDATARAIDLGVRTSATNAFGPDIPCPSAYGYGDVTRTTDGAGAALTVAGVNASELLIKIAA